MAMLLLPFGLRQDLAVYSRLASPSIPLPQPPDCWDVRRVLPHLACGLVFKLQGEQNSQCLYPPQSGMHYTALGFC